MIKIFLIKLMRKSTKKFNLIKRKNILIKNEKKLKFSILNLNNGNIFSIINFLKKIN